ncbi:hypothetical protein BN1051_02388 [Arthrobacter saudimassiliensis]|uniref:Uncharacterized protein n=1 Tax=Arthrobacter saudimassiliensis TaxID=1461584 RepID=A0A078MRX6_9MICC|nr:hypothetical protein BN1051_02388 [Arthrobacter saudimassiliensis]
MKRRNMVTAAALLGVVALVLTSASMPGTI